MITRVEVDGFRNFVNFSIDLKPLVVLAGPNSSGKSNFFDLLMLLSRLATYDSLDVAFSGVRGDPIQQFTTIKPGQHLNRMKIAVEALVKPIIRDQWGDEAELTNTHLRYSIVLSADKDQSGISRIKISEERLTKIKKADTVAKLKFKTSQSFIKKYISWATRGQPYIDTFKDLGMIVLYQDGRKGRKREYKIDELEGTMLSAANTATFRHAFAMRQELNNITQLQLEPEQLREPSKIDVFGYTRNQKIGRHGENLPVVLERLKNKNKKTIAKITSDLRSVVNDVKHVNVWKDEARDQLIAQVGFAHGGPFPASLLSDGTLRILALSTMRHDDLHEGVLCFEEPENGIHPSCMKGLFSILSGLSTNTDKSLPDDYDTNDGIRQVLVNTHSPSLVSIVPEEDLLFAETARYFHEKFENPVIVGRFYPVKDELPLRMKGKERTYVSRIEVVKFLSSVKKNNWCSEKESTD